MVQPQCNPEEYIKNLVDTVTVPRGFRFFVDSFTFSPRERPEAPPLTMNVAAVVSDREGTGAVGVTTRNRFPGAPVRLARERLPGGALRGIVVNNRISNVASPGGYDAAVTVAGALEKVFNLPEGETLSVSTGIIGWQLPLSAMVASVEQLPRREGTIVDFARAIMTTDRYPKAVSRTNPSGATMAGVVKGAGMIEPNMATMLGFFMTDAVVEQTVLESVFRRVVEDTFNTISVDSDQSTSDMVVLLANGESGQKLTETELEELLLPVAEELVLHIVRNGEGAAHVMEVTVHGIADRDLAGRIGKHVVNSPLVKTAVYGNDPNVGRILAALGDALDRNDPEGKIDPAALRIEMFGEVVYRDGAFQLDGRRERLLSDALAASAFDPELKGCPQIRDNVVIELFFGPAGDSADGDVPSCRVLGSDLSYEYVRENADYRS
jgi:glutamate N-acetyltransferase / amino-acid N-acetyltransferase